VNTGTHTHNGAYAMEALSTEARVFRPGPARRLLRLLRVLVCVAPFALGSGIAFAQPGAPLSVPPPGKAASERLPILKQAGLDQRLDAQVPLDITLVDEDGHDVKLGAYFGKRPVVLALVYYECPMLCTQVLNGMYASLLTMNLDAGRDFDVVVVSFDPKETPALAAGKKKAYLERYRRASAEAGTHFLTGREDQVRQLADAIGFHYVYDPTINQFAHPAVITVLTPAGHVSRYLFGIEYAPRDLRFALVEASNGRIGTVVDQMLLFCYHYDPIDGKYGLAVINLVRLGGILTVAGLGAFILVALRRERRGHVASGGRPTATGTR
jgi:protein SCO1/2